MDESHLRQWMNRLGRCNQHRGVDYVTSDGDGNYVCHLCNVTCHRSQIGVHTNGSGHSDNYNAVRRLEAKDYHLHRLNERATDAEALKSHVEALGLPAWRCEIYSAMFFYVASHNPSIAAIEKLLSRYYVKEKLSLLELALCKARICDGVTFSNMLEMREYKILEEDFDEVGYIRESRMTCGSEVVIPLVLEYLCNPRSLPRFDAC